MPLQMPLKALQPKLLKVPAKPLPTLATPLWALLKVLQMLLLALPTQLLVPLMRLPVQLRTLLVPLAMLPWTLLRMLAALPLMLLRTLPKRQCNRPSQQCEKNGVASERMRPFFLSEWIRI
jgi:hypothetical protein